eukprot:30814-Pelagococcus_subviridis.AAC.6
MPALCVNKIPAIGGVRGSLRGERQLAKNVFFMPASVIALSEGRRFYADNIFTYFYADAAAL